MRIWHEQLIPKLCRQHLLACWRESLGAYAIVTGEVDGGSYKNHPAVKEFDGCPIELKNRLVFIRREMLARGYSPKLIPDYPLEITTKNYIPWQTLDQQIEVLKAKKCDCKIANLNL